MWVEWVERYGYVIVFLGCVLEGEMVLILAGYTVARGYLDAGPAAVLAIVGATAGDSLYYWIGRRYGSRFTRSGAKLRPVRARATLLLRRWGPTTALLTRFAYGLRIALPLLMGAGRLRPATFHLFNLIGAILFVTVYGGLGFIFGETVEDHVSRIRSYETRILLGVIVLGLLAWALREWRIHRVYPRDLDGGDE